MMPISKSLLVILASLLAVAPAPARTTPPPSAAAPASTPAATGAAPAAPAATTTPGQLVQDYLEAYFATYPTEATAAGRHDRDGGLEDLSPERLTAWVEYNRRTLARAADLQGAPPPQGAFAPGGGTPPGAAGSPAPSAGGPGGAAAAMATARAAAAKRNSLTLDDRLDLELLSRRAAREVHDLAVRRRPQRDPLFWTDRLGNAMLFLMLREPVPTADRLLAAAKRAEEMPRFAAQARTALAATSPDQISPELAGLAAGQARATAESLRGGFTAWAAGSSPTAARAKAAAKRAATALDELATFLDGVAAKATGSPRLGADYAATFRLGTGVGEAVPAILTQAQTDLLQVREATARYGRSIWGQEFPGEAAPVDDATLLHRLFARVAADHAASTDELVTDYRFQVQDLEKFLRAHDVATLPDPLTLQVGPSPSFLIGQSVGGLYAAGPYEPDAKTLWLLPTPDDKATKAQREAFFRDFNHHFNVMITAHEIFPGHYMQLKIAAHQPHKVRALFPDDTYVEGWGTFCEWLALDQGRGGPLDRLAHLKKQMENVTRTIVDIRVHTQNMKREEVLAFARDEAMQDEQFAANLWTRSITSAPQLTTYYLGDREVQHLYEDVRQTRGAAFSVREFVDGMMALGPVPVAHYREKMLGTAHRAAPPVRRN